jgi:hypothetical protein
MSFTTCTVSDGPLTNPDGSPATGSIVFSLTKPIRNGENLVGTTPVVTQINGSWSQELTCIDDDGTTPTDAGYTYQLLLDGADAVDGFFKLHTTSAPECEFDSLSGS